MTREILLEKVFRAGVVGCGGAGFPTHRKLESDADTYIINGAECEPLLRTDRHLMRTAAPVLVRTAQLVGQLIGAQRTVIALKKTYDEEIRALEQAIAGNGAAVEIFPMEHFYPAGDEQVIVQEVTGRSVPPSGIPPQVGVTVSNVATVLAIGDALEDRPVTDKVLTVTGEVSEPLVIKVPIGTPFSECIALAGADRTRDYRIISGGPMMGKVLDADTAATEVVTKTTSGLILIPAGSYLSSRATISVRHTVNRARAACIQCSYCTQLCPRYLIGHPLEPHRIMRKLAYSGGIEDILDDDVSRQALICCECGICEEYACPMALQPRKVNAMLKAAYAARGERYQKPEGEWQAREERPWRRIPTHNLLSRVGLSAYASKTFPQFAEHTANRVEIPLKQHIGALAQPVVQPGQRVRAGQLIAACPDGALGANVHASISGEVVSVDERISITRKEADV